MFRRRRKYTVSRTSPKGDRRGCLCPDGRTYSTKCCDGSLQAQGIGNITKEPEPVYYLLQENNDNILQENNDKIIL
jgi:hypothetical protein